MKLTSSVLVLICAGLASCVSAPKISSSFNPSDAAFIHQQGKGAIKGQAFLRRNDGIVVYAAGSDVVLIPKTTYSTERINALYGSGKINYYIPSPESPPGFESATRQTKANGEGRFEFPNLADGDYYVVTKVTWMAGNMPQGGALMERAQIRAGATAEIIMSGQ